MGTTAQKLQRVLDTKSGLKDTINTYLGQDITSAIPFKDYETYIKNFYGSLPKTSYAEGSNITLSNTLKGKLDFEDDIVGYGDTSQKSYQGYNILPSVNTTRTINGVTFTHNADGSITANGTASANALYPINVDGTSVTRNVPLVAGSYVIVDSVGDYTNYFCQLSDGTNFANTGSGGAVGKSNTLTLSSQANVSALVYIRSGVQVNNVTFKPMVVTSSNINKSYEPYVGGTASPNPSYPQDIEVVRGKNLLDSQLEKGTYNDNTGEQITTDGNYRNVSPIKVCPNTTYTFSINGVKQKYCVYYYDSSNNFISWIPAETGTFTTPNNCYYINFRCYVADYTSDFANLKIQLEKGSQATSYLPYNTIEVVERGKNYFKYDTNELYTTGQNGTYILQSGIDNNYIDVTQKNNGYYVNSYTNTGYRWYSVKVDLPKNKQLKLICGDTNISGVSNIRIHGFNSLSNGQTGTEIAQLENGTSFNTGNYNYYLLGFYPYQQGRYIEDIMIIDNDITDTTYEPYQTPQTYQLSLGEYEFAKIGNYVDTIEYDVDEDKVYKNENVFEVDKTSIVEHISSVTEITDYVRVVINLTNDYKSLSTANGLCNYFKFEASYSGQSNHFYVMNTQAFIIIDKTLLSTIDTNGVIAFFNSIPNIKIKFALATTTRTEITGTLKDQIKALYYSHSFNGTTIVEINGNLPLIIKVRALKGN